MEKKLHDPKDPDAVLHFAQELDNASAENAAEENRPEETEQSVSSTQKAGTEEGKQPPAKQSAEIHSNKEDESDDDPGLVARITAKGALSGF